MSFFHALDCGFALSGMPDAHKLLSAQQGRGGER